MGDGDEAIWTNLCRIGRGLSEELVPATESASEILELNFASDSVHCASNRCDLARIVVRQLQGSVPCGLAGMVWRLDYVHR